MSRSRPSRKSASHTTGRTAIILAVSLLGLTAGAGHPGAQPTGQSAARSEQNAQARRWFKDAKFGLFIHWGVYSLLRKGEWVMERDKIPIVEYARLPSLFDPTRFDAQAWVKLAKAAGAKYITINAKHHDGFCMYDSKLTDFDIVDAARYHKDPLKALADGCHQEKIKLFFYYSLLDWHHPDYFPGGKTGQTAGRPEKGDPKRYVEYFQGQIRELCTNYGAIGGIWFDGWWDKADADWDLAGTYRLIHELQPGALVGNNHHVAPFPGEDFQMFEQDLPGENTAGFNTANVAARIPLETCMTINQSWGYNTGDTRFKTADQLIHALLAAAGRGANLLFKYRTSPGRNHQLRNSPSGCKMSASGVATYGESVYGTRQGTDPAPVVGRLSPREDRPIIPAKSIYMYLSSSLAHNRSYLIQGFPGPLTCLARPSR